MLTHLGLSGTLENIAGMIVGHLGEPPEPGREAVDWPAQIAGSLARYSWPLGLGLASGHVPPNRTLPLGRRVRLDAGAGRLVFGEE